MVKSGIKQNVFEKCFSLIDYCGDMIKGETTYSSGFSPNNIRLLVISPEGAFVYLHLPYNSSKRIRKAWSVQEYSSYIAEQNLSNKNYQSLVSVLSFKNQCSNIEEVILLKNSTQGVELDGRELEVEGLLKGYREGTGDITEKIRSRYKRLASFSVLNMTMTDFFNWFSTNVQSYDNCTLISDIIPKEYVIPNVSVRLNPEPFKGHCYTLQHTYRMDSDGTLKKHFESIISKYEAKEKQNKVDEFKQKRVDRGTLAEEEKRGKDLLNVLKMYNIMGNLLSKYPNYFASISLSRFEKLDIFESEFVKQNKDKLGNFFNIVQEGSEKENCTKFKVTVFRVYCSLLKYYIESLDNLNPITVNFLYKKDLLCHINVPESLSSSVLGVEEKYKVQFTKVEFSIKSLCSLCKEICVLFVTAKGDKPTALYTDISYWKNIVR